MTRITRTREEHLAYDRARSATRRALAKAATVPATYSKSRDVKPKRVRSRPTDRRVEAVAAYREAAAAGTVATRLVGVLWRTGL